MKLFNYKAIALFVTLAASSAMAYAAAFVEISYYSDASKTTLVGERVINQCRGTVYTTGTVTAFSKITGHEPCGQFN